MYSLRFDDLEFVDLNTGIKEYSIKLDKQSYRLMAVAEKKIFCVITPENYNKDNNTPDKLVCLGEKPTK